MSETAHTPLARQAGLLSAALVVVGLPAFALAYFSQGPQGLASAGLAWCVATFAALAALIPAVLASKVQPPRSDALLISVLGGMLVRMAVPLAAVVFVKLQLPSWFGMTWLAYLVLFYLAALAVETWLALPQLQSIQGSGILRKTS